MHGSIFYRLKVRLNLTKRIFSNKSTRLLTKMEIFLFLFRFS